jgi:NADPH:quinone reductase-like Zn-dependent oxidoreductase
MPRLNVNDFATRMSNTATLRHAWKREVIPTPALRDDEVLVYVMASGINFNNVWAALGTP